MSFDRGTIVIPVSQRDANSTLTEDDIHAVAGETRGESTHLTVVESAVLAAARQIVATPEIEDAVFEELRAGLGERCLVDLVMVISFYCAVVRFLGVFQIDLEPGYDRYLEQFPFASD